MNLDPKLWSARAITRRQFFHSTGLSLGTIALGGLLSRDSHAGAAPKLSNAKPLAPKKPAFARKAKSIIYLHMSGAPPSLDLFDWKPKLAELNLKPCPEELLKGQRFAFIKGVPKMLGSPYKFAQHGHSGAWVSETLPHFSEIVDDVAIIRSMWTDQFNHAPAELFIYTGSARAGAASMGSWLTYGLGTENQDLPGFVVLLSGGTDPTGGKSLWGSGFLPSVYQGVQCRSAGEPILFANNPAGMDRASAALVRDLKQRGLLDETLLIWGGEFGRTPMNEARGGSMFLGRDHHPHCFTIWMAGGGIQPGIVYGETDELGYGVVKDKVSVRDLQTTILHLMGLDAHQLSYRFQGLNQRLIGPAEEGQVVKEILV